MRDAAVSCGYKINLVARALRLQRTNTVLALLPDIGGYFYPEIIKAIERTSRQHGFLMILGLTDNKRDDWSGYIEHMATQRIDGLMIIDSAPSPFDWSSCGLSAPVVQAFENVCGDAVPMIGVDERGVASSAVRHLIELGHRRIAHIAGHLCSGVTRQRLDGYLETLKNAGLSPNKNYVVHSDCSYHSGLDAMQQLLAMKKPPTAVFCANDASALGALRACRMAGLSVPSDISIVGVDDVDEAMNSDPPLTTVRRPRHDIGCCAMEMLVQAIKGRHVENSVKLPTQLIVRETTARCSV